MTRLVLVFLVAVLVALAAAWLAESGGVVTLAIANYEFRTSAAVGMVLLLALGISVSILLKVMTLIVGGPAKVSTFLTNRRAGKAYHALSRGLVAAAAGDAHDAAHAARHAEKLLSGNPLALLLRAQAAELSKDEGQQHAAYMAMLAHSETAFLGARGLTGIAMRRGDSEQALGFALRAHALKPTAQDASDALFQLRLGRGERAEAQALLDEELKTKRLGPETERRWRELLRPLEPTTAAPAPQTAVPLPAEQC